MKGSFIVNIIMKLPFIGGISVLFQGKCHLLLNYYDQFITIIYCIYYYRITLVLLLGSLFSYTLAMIGARYKILFLK